MKKARWAALAAAAVTIVLSPTAIGAIAAPPASTSASTLTAAQVRALALAYKAAHSGRGGKDWDILTKSDAQLANDPAARRLLQICGPHQRPVIPLIAWEYGGADHPWINPGAAAVAYCVYIPVKPFTSHWTYDAARNKVTAEVYARFPEQNPCKGATGLKQVTGCLGDPSNLEILVDAASLHDGHDVGLELAESSTTLRLGKATPLPPALPPPSAGGNPFAAACPAPEQPLVLGATGDCVKKLQWYLIKVQGAQIITGGNFGPLTQAAVLKFQGTRGIAQSGIVAQITWPALKKAAGG